VAGDVSFVPGGIHGGDAGAGPCLFFGVDDLEAVLGRVRELGGAVEELEIDGYGEPVAAFGRFRRCRDEPGSPVGVHEPAASGR
jgi:uncharacterized protein